ncbi:MAG: hypothetical protein RL181_271, partial [Bacteroidota bacterium]
QVVDIRFVVIVEPYLVFAPIVFQLPIRGRGYDQMNALLFEFAHLSAIAIYYFVVRAFRHFKILVQRYVFLASFLTSFV